MLPNPDQENPGTQEPAFLSGTWCDLIWTGWFPFTIMKEEFRIIPKEPGLFRIRPVGKDFLIFVGETHRPLHERLNDLRMSIRNRELMPWSDPFVEAPGLWAWQDADNIAYECSVAPLDVSKTGRLGMASYLLAQYRQESGGSPQLNFNRFHPRYRCSTTRKAGLRGGKLADSQKDNPAGEPGSPPLAVVGSPGEPGWMGLAWSMRQPLTAGIIGTLPPAPGLNLVFESGSDEILAIGNAQNCPERLERYCREQTDNSLEFSWCPKHPAVLPHVLKEQTNDLLGNYFAVFRKMPEWQFGKFS